MNAFHLPRRLRAPFHLALVLAAPLAAGGRDPDATAPDAWQVSAGGGVVSRPLYAGSAQRKVSGFPLFSAQRGRYFIGSLPGAGVPAGAGAYLVRDDRWQLGVGVGADFGKPRKEADSPSLRGLGDIEASAFGTLFAHYDQGAFGARAALLRDIGGNGQGTRARFEIEGRQALGEQLTLTVAPSLTWADRSYTQTHFGISAAQSASSGRPAYAAGAGVQAVGVGVGLRWQPAPAWMAGAMVEASRLRGAAAASPLVERRMQTTAGLFAAYQF